jgi:hypothetical protein
MTDTLTVKLDPETAARLRRVAAAEGESVEALVKRVLEDVAIELDQSGKASRLSDEQLADLRERLKNPGPIASPERVAEVLSKFRPKSSQ